VGFSENRRHAYGALFEAAVKESFARLASPWPAPARSPRRTGATCRAGWRDAQCHLIKARLGFSREAAMKVVRPFKAG